MSKLLSPGGHLLILDSKDSLIRWSPCVKAVEGLMEKLSKRQRAAGIGRGAIGAVKKQLRRNRFRVTPTDELIIPANTNRMKDRFVELFQNLEKLAKAHFGVPFDSGMKTQLEAWRRTPDSYAQLGLGTLLLRRN